MAKALLLCALNIHLITLVFCASVKKPPTWSNNYRLKGVLYLPHSEIEEPFEAWYSEPTKQARRDSYNGTDQLYILGNVGKYGVYVFSIPVTTKHVMNQRTNSAFFGEENCPIVLSNFLPDITGFTFVGEETIEGVVAEKWQIVYDAKFGRSMKIMWLYNRIDPNDKTKSVSVPIKYVLRSPGDYHYYKFDTFEVGSIDPNVFSVTYNATSASPLCHSSVVSPIKELIDPVDTSYVDSEFNKFVNRYDKRYATSKETEYRKTIFKHNLRYIQSVNRQHRGYTLAVNHLADKTSVEMNAMNGVVLPADSSSNKTNSYENIDTSVLPKEFNWQLRGAVTPVKDQADCGSCWAFSTTGAIEGAYFLKHGRLVSFSEQNLMDCSWGYNNNGCNGGGYPSQAFQWNKDNGGMATEEDYGPYLDMDGYCHVDFPKLGLISGSFRVKPNDPDALKYAIFKHGPVSVLIDSDPASFKFYESGVYYEPKCRNGFDQLNHAVLAVGYGNMDGQDYWLIKNSWADTWGNDGYILMAVKDNNCGVMTDPWYVTM